MNDNFFRAGNLLLDVINNSLLQISIFGCCIVKE